MDEATTSLLVELNNEGAFLLGRGQLGEAIAVYESALERVTRTLRGVDDASSNQSTDEGKTTTPLLSEEVSPAIGPNNDHDNAVAAASSDSSPKAKSPTKKLTTRKPTNSCKTKRRKSCSATTKKSVSKRSSRRLVVPPRAKEEDHMEQCEEQNGRAFFLYDKPMRVEDRYTIPDPLEVCLFVVYNLALSVHLAAVDAASNAASYNSMRRRKRNRKEGRKAEKSMLKRALNLYKEAHTLQIQWGIEMSESHCLALWNNIAHAFHVLGIEEVADTSLQHLQTRIFYTVFRGYGEEVDNLDAFLLNIMHLVFKKSLVVAPAA